MKILKPTVVILTTIGRSVRIRTDNGPGTSIAKPELDPAFLPGVGLVQFRADGRIVEADAANPTAVENRRYYNAGIGGWRIEGTNPPPAPVPGPAFPGACRENPGTCGGGLAIARGEEATVAVRCFLSDYDTKRPHPAYPEQFVDVV